MNTFVKRCRVIQSLHSRSFRSISIVWIACCMLLSIFPLSVQAEQNAEEIKSIEKQISALSAQITKLEQQRQHFIELEGEITSLEREKSSANDERAKVLDGKILEVRKELEELKPGVIKLEYLKEDRYKLDQRLKDLTVGTTPYNQTMEKMKAIAFALEAFAADHDSYPEGKTIMELKEKVEPQYVKELPLKDDWGKMFVYKTDDSRQTYWIISYGADGKPDSGIYDSKLLPNKSAAVETTNPGDDIIFSIGNFLRYPKSERTSAE